jgi:chromosome segregation ATPase
MKKIAMILVTLMILAGSANGGTIYIWTDENGVKRFSDAPPPKGIENYETAVGSTSKPAEGQREGLTKMLEEQEQQSREEDVKKEAAEAAQAAEQKRKAQAEEKARIQPERDRLQKQINDLQNRALSPTFTEGMRQNQIEKIQKQIDALSN